MVDDQMTACFYTSPGEQEIKRLHTGTTGTRNAPAGAILVLITPNLQYEDGQESLLISTARNLSLPQNFVSEERLECPPHSIIPSWAGSHALTCKASTPLKKVGFLPILPHPITNIETVYTVLVNLNSIATVLKQGNFAFCM